MTSVKSTQQQKHKLWKFSLMDKVLVFMIIQGPSYLVSLIKITKIKLFCIRLLPFPQSPNTETEINCQPGRKNTI